MAISRGKRHSDWFATFEHLIPRQHGGTDALANLALAHRRCNNNRGNDLARQVAEPLRGIVSMPALPVAEAAE